MPKHLLKRDSRAASSSSLQGEPASFQTSRQWRRRRSLSFSHIDVVPAEEANGRWFAVRSNPRWIPLGTRALDMKGARLSNSRSSECFTEQAFDAMWCFWLLPMKRFKIKLSDMSLKSIGARSTAPIPSTGLDWRSSLRPGHLRHSVGEKGVLWLESPPMVRQTRLTPRPDQALRSFSTCSDSKQEVVSSSRRPLQLLATAGRRHGGVRWILRHPFLVKTPKNTSGQPYPAAGTQTQSTSQGWMAHQPPMWFRPRALHCSTFGSCQAPAQTKCWSESVGSMTTRSRSRSCLHQCRGQPDRGSGLPVACVPQRANPTRGRSRACHLGGLH